MTELVYLAVCRVLSEEERRVSVLEGCQAARLSERVGGGTDPDETFGRVENLRAIDRRVDLLVGPKYKSLASVVRVFLRTAGPTNTDRLIYHYVHGAASVANTVRGTGVDAGYMVKLIKLFEIYLAKEGYN